MTIHLPEELARSIRAEVLGGHFASEDEMVAVAVRDYLRRQQGPAAPASGAAAVPPAQPEEEPSAPGLQRRLFEAGVIGEIKPPITDLAAYRHRQAVPIQGEPLSETILRERAVDVAVYFLDTSTVVKRYVQETGTAWVEALAAPAAGHALFLVRITLAEMVAAVTRRERGGHLSAPAAATALADFQYDFDHQYVIVEVSAALVARAAALARTHALRGYDAVQLAAALEVHALAPSLALLSADAGLNAAAAAEGLSVDNPNAHP